jgi:hypothetical protein
LYKYKDKYEIEFQLLQPDEKFNYNCVLYEKTIELKKLFKQWFVIMDKLLNKCNSKNWLVKSYVSQAWGVLSKYKTIKVKNENIDNYDCHHLKSILKSNDIYQYYIKDTDESIYKLIESNNAYYYKGLARIKAFLPEYCRNYVFNLVSNHNLENNVIRIHTDSICFDREVNFESLKIDYYPIPEQKTTGYIKFYNVNSYFHICEKCSVEYKFDKNEKHICF